MPKENTLNIIMKSEAGVIGDSYWGQGQLFNQKPGIIYTCHDKRELQ